MLYPNNLQKYAGTIIIQKKKYIFQIIKNKKIIEQTEFTFKNELEKKEAYENIIQYKKDYSIIHNLVKNKYEINNDKINVYLQSDKYFTTDKNKLDRVDKFIWYVLDGYIGTMITENKRRKKLYFHHYIMNNENVIHKDGDKMNNTKDNLNILDKKDVLKIQHFTHMKRKDNTTGYTGVYRCKYKDKDYWEVKGNTFNGDRVYRKYSIIKYGDNGAYSMACHYRDIYINDNYKNHILATDDFTN